MLSLAQLSPSLFNLIMKSSVMDIHDFAGFNLIFTMTTRQHVNCINVVHKLISLDVIVTMVKFTFILCYFPRGLVKIGICCQKQDNFGRRIFIVV